MPILTLDVSQIILRIIYDAHGNLITMEELVEQVRQELADHHGEALEPMGSTVRAELGDLKARRLISEEPKGSFCITALGSILGMGILLPSKVP
ncbi:MAG: hypothetical protein AAB524_02515 [Patescibacteria group bacterium]